MTESELVEFPTAFSVDFFRTTFTESSLFSFWLKKLPLEALGHTVPQLLTSGHFWPNGRLGPPDSEPGLRSGGFSEKKLRNGVKSNKETPKNYLEEGLTTLRGPRDYSLEFRYCFLHPFSRNSALLKTRNVPQNRPFFIPEWHRTLAFGGFQIESKKSI